MWSKQGLRVEVSNFMLLGVGFRSRVVLGEKEVVRSRFERREGDM